MTSDQSQGMRVSATAFPWYRRDEYDELRRMFVDGHKLHPTYDGWLAAAELGERHLVQQGHHVVRAELRPTAFKAWCEKRGRSMDSKARGEFASEAAYQAAIQSRTQRSDTYD